MGIDDCGLSHQYPICSLPSSFLFSPPSHSDPSLLSPFSSLSFLFPLLSLLSPSGLLYEARPQATRLHVNESLCVSSEHYMPVVPNEIFEKTPKVGHTPVTCTDGEVLTGLASTGQYDTTPTGSGVVGTTLTGSSARCGVPSGFKVEPATAHLANSLGSGDSNEIETANGCSFRAMICPAGTVAVGFQYDESQGGAKGDGNGNYCNKAVLSMRLVCATYTMTDSAQYRRMCGNGDCAVPLATHPIVRHGTVLANASSECTSKCSATDGCVAVQIESGTDVTTCTLYGGQYTPDKATPYGKPVRQYDFQAPAVVYTTWRDRTTPS